MYLDASAIVAILAGEDDAEQLTRQIENAETPFFISPLSVFEAIAGLAKTRAETNKPVTPEMLNAARVTIVALLERIGAKEISISPDIGRKAQEAMLAYGKIIAHPARLNFGDCFVYACAKAYRIPLLFKGNDFSQTDLG